MVDEDHDREMYTELGRRLFAAVMSCQLGVSYATVGKRYRDEPLGAYWTALARRVMEEQIHLMNQR